MNELRQTIKSDASPTQKRVCIITADIFGLVKNGGIGTAYYHLAVFLQRMGHEVSICFVNMLAKNPEKMRIARDLYSSFGIKLHGVVPQPLAETEMARTMALPYAAYEWLRANEKQFDLIHVSEWRGLGYISLLAKKLGIAFQNIHFVIKGSSPTLWLAEGNQQFLRESRQLGWVFMERQSVEMADTFICGSKHLLCWMKQNGYNLPKQSYFWPNVFLDDLAKSNSEPMQPATTTVNEWVFFGRLEPRKGVILFINAINYLVLKGVSLPEITFLGGPSHRFDAKRFIKNNCASWQTSITYISDLNAMEAVEYLSGAGRLAVIPALLENSPVAVYECLAAHIPFIAADTGGTGELIDGTDRERILFKPHHLALAEKLQYFRELAPTPANKHQRLLQSLIVWKSWHDQELFFPAKRNTPEVAHPLVSVCITHFDRPKLLSQALESIKKQTYQNIEVILVDDGSRSAEAISYLQDLKKNFAGVPLRIIYQENRYVGAARNTAAYASRGEYLLFFDDDNVMMPNMVENLVYTATLGGWGCLTCSSIRFSGKGKPLTIDSSLGTQMRFMGPSRAWATKINVVGDATCLVNAIVFESHGGYTERYRTGKDDIEFYNKLILAQEKVAYYPDALYYYRVGENSMKTRNHLQEEADFRQITPFLEKMDTEEKSLFLLRHESPDLTSLGHGESGKKYTLGKFRLAMQSLRKLLRADA
ncbi:glycosyltransferase [Flexibacterium corallicola]|uniref:glycosyltransferase n=1 Tax=Flexibacterium corallicola TaxID=3037259 RepID=UPI00286F8172|nr:glycosyltransferase [Pseudovibrio sp. M1P-2-3]